MRQNKTMTPEKGAAQRKAVKSKGRAMPFKKKKSGDPKPNFKPKETRTIKTQRPLKTIQA